MRSPKYHDYRVLKIALFIILVVLGLFIYIKCVKEPLEHTAGANSWVVDKEATCTDDGLRYKVCTECGEKFDHEVIPATGHDINDKWIVEKEATCTKNGARYKTCNNCDEKFEREEIPALNHTPGSAKTENWVASTCTVGGSYDKVVYCTICNEQVSKEKVQLALAAHTPGTAIKQNVLDSTHTNPGTYEAVVKCKKCGTEISREPKIISPKGHTYSWELVYNEETKDFTMVGTCTCNEEGNVFTMSAEDGLVITLDVSVPSCCIKRYIGTISYDGKTIVKTVEIETDAHKIERMEIVYEGEVITAYIPITDYAKWDDEYGWYYDLSIPGLGYYETEHNIWDDNGFALGVYKCVLCEDEHCSECNGDYWYVVRVYSSKYDKRINQESTN